MTFLCVLVVFFFDVIRWGQIEVFAELYTKLVGNTRDARARKVDGELLFAGGVRVGGVPIHAMFGVGCV